MMFDVDAILKNKQEEAARLEELQRPINALYQLIVEEGSVCNDELSKRGIRIRFRTDGFDQSNRLSFLCELRTTEFYSNTVDTKRISLAMKEKAYEVCFETEHGSEKIVLLGNADAALSQVLKHLSTTMAPALSSYLQTHLKKEHSL